VVMLAGATRLALGASVAKSIRAAVISGPEGMFKPGDETRILHGEVLDKERAQSTRRSDAFRTGFSRTLDAKPGREPELLSGQRSTCSCLKRTNLCSWNVHSA